MGYKENYNNDLMNLNIESSLPVVNNNAVAGAGNNERFMTEVIKGYSEVVKGFSGAITSAINTVPSVMNEQRENMRYTMSMLREMEDMGMININKKVEVASDPEPSFKDYLIGAFTLFGGILLIGLIL